ncbi:hypothetical protein BDK51DRAFT_41578 [Blyttiomyces helicus]|uniref:Uncharacterized protein n=1 Tax=Blyttiomyces helicus TaxID=388810 RepID=A0A4V1IPZ3_9FUNG|nr:hypothetical protein BDK51DRAFT_41578 [Blyttiomyces helicus]|eukprot:RKO84757.1 hypothetical protein BDK51DRAFT_41578 [Blyttiomyces helicus]
MCSEIADKAYQRAYGSVEAVVSCAWENPTPTAGYFFAPAPDSIRQPLHQFLDPNGDRISSTPDITAASARTTRRRSHFRRGAKFFAGYERSSSTSTGVCDDGDKQVVEVRGEESGGVAFSQPEREMDDAVFLSSFPPRSVEVPKPKYPLALDCNRPSVGKVVGDSRLSAPIPPEMQNVVYNLHCRFNTWFPPSSPLSSPYPLLGWEVGLLCSVIAAPGSRWRFAVIAGPVPDVRRETGEDIL